MKAPLPADESQRLEALRQYAILDTLPEVAFDDLTLLAAQICQTPIAVVSFVDEARQWFKSRIGLDAQETHRDAAFCAHAILHKDEILEVRDASLDPRFSDNPLVTSDPNMRFYAGTPLVVHDGHALGTLCVIDRVPRALSEAQRQALQVLGRHVVTLIETRQIIAARQRAEDALRQANAWQQTILDSAALSIIATDSQGVIRTFNRASEKMLGYRAEEVVGSPMPPIIYDAQEVRRRAAELTRELGRVIEPAFEVFVAKARSGTPEEREWTYRRKGGTLFPVRLTVTAVFDAAGQIIGFMGIAADITERKRADELLRQSHEDLRAAMEQAQQADRIKSAFLATMSHELRTPLNSIIGFTGILLQGLAGGLNAEQAKQLGMVQNSARHLLALINDLLDISKIEAGELRVEREPFDLQASMAKVIGIVMPLAERKGLTLRFEVAPALGQAVGDARRVEQVLLNLLNNAIKFTQQGEVGLSAELHGDAAQIRVADTGIGIKPDDMKTMFKPFRQIDDGLARNHEGTGLGLAICQRLAELMGGEIRAESEWGKGSTFSFTLPLKGPVTP